MSKFNQVASKAPNSVNTAGGVAYTRDFEKEVASLVLNSMVNGDSFYETETDRLARIESTIVSNPNDALFLAKAMVYARNEGNLRSVSHFMGSLLTESVKGQPFMKNALVKIMVRPDDATEMIGLWNARNPGKMVPNALRKATKVALENRWDAYQLKKYFGNGAVKVSNLINICHPAPRDESQRVMFKQALEGSLPAIMTAQTVNAGSTGESRANNYAMMLAERKLGYMAALKNLKNILEAGADTATIDALCDLLRNERACLKSRVLPFRFTQAYAMVDAMSMDRLVAKKVLKAIEDGFIISARNIPIVDDGESVALLLDESGSMSGWGNYGSDTDITSKSPFMVGKTLMASMLVGLDKSRVTGWLWADRAREVSIDGSPMDFIKNTRTTGGGTDVHAAIMGLIKTKTIVDKLVIFTDLQMYNIGNDWGAKKAEFKDSVAKYRKLNPNVKVLFWNLEGYKGGSPMKLDHDILEVSGYSDKMLSVIPKMWKDKNALIKEINAVEI